MPAIRDIMRTYECSRFINADGSISYKNIVEITSEYLVASEMENTNTVQKCAGFTIYPVDYFCPISFETRKMVLTANTRTIHHFAESWVPRSTRLKNAIGRILGQKFLQRLVSVKAGVKYLLKYVK
jgi:hypothetical protein